VLPNHFCSTAAAKSAPWPIGSVALILRDFLDGIDHGEHTLEVCLDVYEYEELQVVGVDLFKAPEALGIGLALHFAACLIDFCGVVSGAHQWHGKFSTKN
jgi:hypothetical protein